MKQKHAPGKCADKSCCEPSCSFICTGELPEVCGFRVGTPWGDIIWFNPLGEEVPFVWESIGENKCRIQSSTENHIVCEHSDPAYQNESLTCTSPGQSVTDATLDTFWYTEVMTRYTDVTATVIIENVSGVSKISATIDMSFGQGTSAVQGYLWADNNAYSYTNTGIPDPSVTQSGNCLGGFSGYTYCNLSGGYAEFPFGFGNGIQRIVTTNSQYDPVDPETLETCLDILNPIPLTFNYGSDRMVFRPITHITTPLACGGSDFLPSPCTFLPPFLYRRRWAYYVFPGPTTNSIVNEPMGTVTFEVQLLECES
jgi:hypothetical protein